LSASHTSLTQIDEATFDIVRRRRSVEFLGNVDRMGSGDV